MSTGTIAPTAPRSREVRRRDRGGACKPGVGELRGRARGGRRAAGASRRRGHRAGARGGRRVLRRPAAPREQTGDEGRADDGDRGADGTLPGRRRCPRPADARSGRPDRGRRSGRVDGRPVLGIVGREVGDGPVVGPVGIGHRSAPPTDVGRVAGLRAQGGGSGPACSAVRRRSPRRVTGHPAPCRAARLRTPITESPAYASIAFVYWRWSASSRKPAER